MSSVLRPVRKHKKGRTLGSVEIIRREDYADLELDAKVELIRSSARRRATSSSAQTEAETWQRLPVRLPRVLSVTAYVED